MARGRCLIVANQTLGGKALERAVLDCISRETSTFYVVVPTTAVEHEASNWKGGFVEEGVSPERAAAAREEDARRQEAAFQEAQRRAQRRLDLMIGKIQILGGEAEGAVGPEDPFEATRLALEGQPSFAEVIVSTLPSGISRWLKMDLPSRIQRLTDVPVTTIEAED